MTGSARQTGHQCERAAERFLESRGMKILDRNYNCRVGELDLVAMDNAALVFIEVRYRRNDRFGSGADTVNWHKQRRISAAARRYLQFHPGLQHATCRFDVISMGHEEGRLLINWVRNAFCSSY